MDRPDIAGLAHSDETKFAAAGEAPASGTAAADAEMLGTARRGAEFKVAAASHNMLLISPESRSTAHTTRPARVPGSASQSKPRQRQRRAPRQRPHEHPVKH